MKCSISSRSKIAGAIRPLDVAAIICVVAVLAWLALMGVGRFREGALRTRCAGNLRQMAVALQLYSKSNHDLLPDCSPANPRLTGPVWPWDISTNLVADLESGGMKRETFYCPANSGMDDDRHWNFWRSNPGGIRVIGYPALFKGTAQVPPNLWREKWNGSAGNAPSKTELVFDATAALNGDYTRIQGNYIDHSNHLRGKDPLGGNILFLDQHVEWRDFKNMQMRLRTIGPAGVIAWSY